MQLLIVFVFLSPKTSGILMHSSREHIVCWQGSHLIMHRTIGLTGYMIGPLTLVRWPVDSPMHSRVGRSPGVRNLVPDNASLRA